MENSRKILTGGDDSATWFVVIGQDWVGPMTMAEILEKIQATELTWAHFAWREGESNWRRLCDIPDFQAAVPNAPAQDVQKRIVESTRSGVGSPPPPPAQEKPVERIWFLYYNDSQFGPFSGEEISRFLRIGKIHGRVHVWRDGLANWQRLEAVAEFSSAIEEAKKARAATSGSPAAPGAKGSVAASDPNKVAGRIVEQRGNPRRPLVARIFLTSEETVVVGICRDISVGGMQVLTDVVPGPSGTHIKMNVSPSSGELGGNIPPFVAEGVIVRILEDGRGFSFRFDHLPDNSRQAIEEYIASTD